jgi:exodeoxyribonuclease VII large subunit
VLAETTIELGVSEFVELLNQTLEFAYPDLVIVGELANFRVSKNRWIYFDLKDERASVKFFGTIYNLPGPLEDGMLLKVRGQPRLHNLYGFSITVMTIQPSGEGSIRRAANLLQAKLASEGLFDEARKRSIPYPPQRIGLITSKQSAAYADFVKILQARWRGIDVELVDVQVQGEIAPKQIVTAIEQLNSLADPPEAIVIIRGGGSAEDLAAFSTETVTRAVAMSRIPTLVAIGHEIDLSLAEMAADRRASTPSNAAELLVPDRLHIQNELLTITQNLEYFAVRHVSRARKELIEQITMLNQRVTTITSQLKAAVHSQKQLLAALNPETILRRGYAIVRQNGRILRSSRGVQVGAMIDIQLADGGFSAAVEHSKRRLKGKDA